MQWSSFLRVFLPVAVVGGFLLIAAAVGRRLTRRWRWTDPLEALATSTTLGLAALGLGLFVLGLGSGLRRFPLVVAAALAALWARGAWRDLWADAVALLAAARAGIRWSTAVAGIGLGLAVGGLLYSALYPPTHFDATMYHLPYVELSMATGRLPYGPDLRYAVFPQLAEVLFTPAVTFSNELGAQVLNAAITLLAALVLALWVRAAAPPRSGWAPAFAAALLLGSPLLLWLGASGYVEPPLILWTVGAGFLANRFDARREDGWLHAAAFLAGSAAATKYTGLLVVVVLAGWVAARRFGARRLAWTGFFVALAAAPWYLRILAVTGNPFSPLFNRWFIGTGRAIPWRIRFIEGTGGGSLAVLRRHLWHLLQHGIWHGVRTNGYNPALLLALPIAFWAVAWWRRGRLFLAGAVLGLAVYLGQFQDVRHALLSALLLMLVVAAGLARAVEHTGRWRGALACALTLLVLVPAFSALWWKVRRAPIPPLSAESRDRYLGRRVLGYEAVRYLNETKGSQYSVYATPGEFLIYYADGRLVGDLFGRYAYETVQPALDDAHWLHARLSALGVDHLLLRAWNLAKRLPETPEFRSRFRLVYDDGQSLVYELLADGPR